MSQWLKRAARGAREAVENSEAVATALAAQRFRWWASPWSGLAWNWADAAKARTSEFKPSRAQERSYERVLRGLATKIDSVLKNNHPRDAENILREYAEIIEPWARQSAENMLMGVSRDNAAKFKRLASRMGYDMRIFLAQDGVGRAVAERIEANTALIKSLPLDAAIRAGELAHESLITGMRAEDIAAQLHKIGGTTLSRARTIALTEVSKASTALTKARAESVDSEGYIWRSVRDGATRPSHRAMEGKFVKWSEPPTLDGMTGHAREFPNCRCYPEPVIPKSDGKGFYGPFLPTQEEERESGQKKLLTQWEKTIGSELVPYIPGEPLMNVDKARFVPEKLTAYSLDPSHPRGKDKARLWKATIGATAKDAAIIEKQVMAWLEHLPATPSEKVDQYGVRFDVLVPVTGPNGKTVDVTTGWIYQRSTDGLSISTHPRLTTLYPSEKSNAV